MPRKKSFQKRTRKNAQGRRRPRRRHRGGTKRKTLNARPWTSGNSKALVGPPWKSKAVGSNHFSLNKHNINLSPNLSCSGSLRSYAGGARKRRTRKGGGRWSFPLVQPIFNGLHEYSGKAVAAWQGKPAWSGKTPTSPYGQLGYSYNIF